MRVLYIISGLGTGGAEKQLSLLNGELVKSGVVVSVLALRGGSVKSEIEAIGVPVQVMTSTSWVDFPTSFFELIRIAKAFTPDVVQGWMYHGNIVASLVRRWAAPRARLVWGVRQSLHAIAREKPLTQAVIRASAWLSKGAAAIVYNSQTARNQHEAAGFSNAGGWVIDNGIDAHKFQPDARARLSVRDMLGLAQGTLLIGLVARYHPMKGHEVFLRAADLLLKKNSDVHFVLIGHGVLPDQPALIRLLSDLSVGQRLHCLGERRDIPALTAAFDIACSSSWGEAFPNALGEAMSCGVPVVATDVGDVRRIVGDAGVVVPSGDAQAMAQAWERLLNDPVQRHTMGAVGRQRVMSLFGVTNMAARYLDLYRGMVSVK